MSGIIRAFEFVWTARIPDGSRLSHLLRRVDFGSTGRSAELEGHDRLDYRVRSVYLEEMHSAYLRVYGTREWFACELSPICCIDSIPPELDTVKLHTVRSNVDEYLKFLQKKLGLSLMAGS